METISKKPSDETIEKLRIITACYNKIILDIDKAKRYIRDNEPLKKSKQLQKAINTLILLQENLNFEMGGDIVNGLDSVYSYMITKLTAAKSQQDDHILDECVYILTEIRDATELGVKAQ